MKKQCLIVLATVAAMIIGMGSLALAQSVVVAQAPGDTVVQDPEGDLLLRKCDADYPLRPCSLPPGASLALPGYFDINAARITQLGRGLVDLSIKVYEPIPPEPPYDFVSYIWQFQGGCAVTPPPGVLNKDSISVVWQDWGDGMEWRAYWYVITDCDNRAIQRGDRIFSFEFTDDGVKVRVRLEDLMTATDEIGTLTWHAAVRRVAFIYYIDTTKIEHTTGADYAPDVVKFDGTTPEDFAYWVSR